MSATYAFIVPIQHKECDTHEFTDSPLSITRIRALTCVGVYTRAYCRRAATGSLC